MSKAIVSPPPDQAQRHQALDAGRSVLVQAPAGSGKTDLLTRRFLRLLAKVEDPTQIVAITFTKAAAAEMRNRILAELDKASQSDDPADPDNEFEMSALARRALERGKALHWRLTDLPAQLSISTIDSFCRDLAIQQPLLSGFGSELSISEQPGDLYRRAARRALEQIDGADAELANAIATLLLWRDNNWHEMEELLVTMLAQRDRWMHDFLVNRQPDWDQLRARLERPFAEAARKILHNLDQLFDRAPDARPELHDFIRFGFTNCGDPRFQDLAEMADFPTGPFDGAESLDTAMRSFHSLAALLLTKDRVFRQRIDKSIGFPADRKAEKARLAGLISALRAVEGLQSAFSALEDAPPARYTDDEWQIVRACFILLRHAAGQLQAVFAEAGSVDFIEVAQIAMRVLSSEDGRPSDTAINTADRIHHLLVDEFQDTSRRQHALIASLTAAWPEPAGRTVFVVGDPMQSIYFFRDADAELFARVRTLGLESPNGDSLPLDFVPLSANFRTQPALVNDLNDRFKTIFTTNDGSGIEFSPATPAREASAGSPARTQLHFEFALQVQRGDRTNSGTDERREQIAEQREAARATQIDKIISLIREHLPRLEWAHASGNKYRIAVLGRTHKSLAPIAQALHKAGVPFRAVELEGLKDRPEVLDALALARALLNPMDRVAWLGVLRAPWCGLSLADLYVVTSEDDPTRMKQAIPDLLREHVERLTPESRTSVDRLLNAVAFASRLCATAPDASLGTWLEQIWLQLGGASCVDATGMANLDLLWSCLDRLPNGAQDLVGPAIDAALQRLKALPDPAASSDYGVQLMTIHKSKGLEFEVVIVPDLQAASARTRPGLLSWLERGLTEPDASGEATEFLVAPLPTKGGSSGDAKQWVDRVIRNRELQETRRLLYVAATRAREELHLFAHPEVKIVEGEFTLVEPRDSLLKTAWPALADEVQAQFESWKLNAAVEESEEAVQLAASGPSPLANINEIQPSRLHRLPAHFSPPPINSFTSSRNDGPVDLERVELFTRHEGGLLSRAFGTAVHIYMEELARLRTTRDWVTSLAALESIAFRIASEIRATGISREKAEPLALNALQVARKAAADPTGQWILSPHEHAESEVSWTGMAEGSLRTVRVDRVFRAGATPNSEGNRTWWIIDYKTAHADDLDPARAKAELRALFAPQLEAYATVLRNIHGTETTIFAGLYYPRMLWFDWWQVAN